MHKVFSVGLSLVIVITAFFLGAWLGGSGSGRHDQATGPKVLYYVDPMNPSHTSTKPGPAPCGMPMEPVYAEGEGSNPPDSHAPPHPGTVKINSQKQQIIGVQVAVVEKKPASRAIRTSGLVALDEARIYRVSSSSGGWVREIYAYTTGSMVMKDEPLFSFYSSTFLSAQQSYFYILNTLDNMRTHEFDEIERQNFTNVQLRTATDSLRNMGVGEKQLRELSKSRQYVRNVVVSAPATGLVVARNLTLDQKFEPGAELYRIADLSSMWVLADVYRDDRQGVYPGQAVRVYSPDLGQEFEATVSHVPPLFDAASRTAKVRLDVRNPDFLLRPDMYVDVHFEVELPPAINIPMDAVLDAGARKTVFVDRGNGSFEPREVETGWRFGDRVEVREGLMEGERVVVSGNFLIDSESRMKLAATGFYGEVAKDPVCHMFVDQERAVVAGLKREYGGKAYYFCSALCRGEFDKQPDRFTGKEAVTGPLPERPREAGDEGTGHQESPPDQPMPAHKHGAGAHQPTHDHGAGKWDATSGFVKDVVCSMPIRETKARQEGLVSEVAGNSYFFCSKQCKQSFDKNPDRFLSREMPPQPAGDMADHTEHRP